MKALDYINNALSGGKVNSSALAKIEAKYGAVANDEAKRVLASVKGSAVFFDDDGFYKLLSLDEIIDASDDMNVDFVAIGIIPIIDAGENDYISFDKNENAFCRFNIAEEFKYAKRNSILDCFVY